MERIGLDTTVARGDERDGSRSRRSFLTGLGTAAVVGVAGCTAPSPQESSQSNEDGGDGRDPVAFLVGSAVMYKGPGCRCCDGYASILDSVDGVSLTIEDRTDMPEIKSEFGVPQSLYSCHTIDGEAYAIEGHVPLDAIRQLADARPDVTGIGLPGMPQGSPGMGGEKSEPFQIYTFEDGTASEFTTL